MKQKRADLLGCSPLPCSSTAIRPPLPPRAVNSAIADLVALRKEVPPMRILDAIVVANADLMKN